MADSSIKRMWDYWSGKYGRVEALRDYYPNLLAADLRLQQAVAALENAEAAIDARMAELASKEPGDG